MNQPVLNYDTPQPMPSLRFGTIALLSALALALLAIMAAAVNGLLIAHLWNLCAIKAPLNPSELQLNGVLTMVGDDILPIVLIVAFISLIGWMYTPHRSLRALSPDRMRFSDIDAVLCWMMPRAIMIRPFEVMKEIYVTSRGELKGKFTPVVGCWWGFLIAATFFEGWRYLTFSSMQRADTDAYSAYGIWGTLCAAIYLVSFGCLIVIVYRIGRAQARRQRSLQPSGTA